MAATIRISSNVAVVQSALRVRPLRVTIDRDTERDLSLSEPSDIEVEVGNHHVEMYVAWLLPALRTTVLANHSRACGSDRENHPDPDHGCHDCAAVSTGVVVVGDERYKASNHSADPGAHPHSPGPARPRECHRRSGI